MRSGMRVLILECLLLTGRDAQAAWDIAGQQERLLRNSGLVVLRTVHASAQALQTSDPLERARRIDHRVKTWNEAGRIVRMG